MMTRRAREVTPEISSPNFLVVSIADGWYWSFDLVRISFFLTPHECSSVALLAQIVRFTLLHPLRWKFRSCSRCLVSGRFRPAALPSGSGWTAWRRQAGSVASKRQRGMEPGTGRGARAWSGQGPRRSRWSWRRSDSEIQPIPRARGPPP